MVNVLVIAYGEPHKTEQKVRELHEWLQKNDLGMVREVKILDLAMKREGLRDLLIYLNPAHPSITRLTKKHIIRLLLKALKFMPFEDTRHEKFKSPNFNIIGIREDRIRENGKEAL